VTKVYIPEGKSETDVTDKIFTVEHLNKIISLVGGKQIISQKYQHPIPGRRIDNVGFTESGSAIIFEHMDMSGNLDQVHMDKGRGYGEQMSLETNVEGVFILCDKASPYFIAQARKIREHYLKRPKKYSHYNLHLIKSQWTLDGDYVPELIDNNIEIKELIPSTINYYKDFVKIYGADWSIQREDYKKANDRAITLWHRIPELDNNYMAYIHTLSNSVKIGLHCEPKRKVSDDEKTFLKSVSPQDWIFRDSAEMKATIELTLPLDSSQEQWADETEKLKRKVRASL